MMLSRVVALGACLLGVAVAPASAAWTDTSQADGSPLQLLTLTAPTLSCAPSGLTSAAISWTPSSVPTALTYTAAVVSSSAPLTVSSNTVTVTTGYVTGILGLALGATMTVRVTATLPGSSWSTSSTINLSYISVLGVSLVSC